MICANPECQTTAGCQCNRYVTWHQLIPQGWVCPKCGGVFAPTCMTCLYCTPVGSAGTNTGQFYTVGPNGELVK